jgi:hypothetical protein
MNQETYLEVAQLSMKNPAHFCVEINNQGPHRKSFTFAGLRGFQTHDRFRQGADSLRFL